MSKIIDKKQEIETEVCHIGVHDMQLAKEYTQALDSNKYPNDFFPELCGFFRKRKLSLCVDNHQEGILITGINPSRKRTEKHDDDFFYTFKDVTIGEMKKNGNIKVGYWRQKYKLLGELIKETAYLDLYPFGFTSQNGFEDLIEDNIQFRAAIVSITQREIETYIKPVLIIVANKQSSYYWGNEDATWMGYDMEKISDEMELYQIKGFKNKQDRINQDLKESSLSGSLILFYGMYDERHKKKQLTAEEVKKIYEMAKTKKQEWKGIK